MVRTLESQKYAEFYGEKGQEGGNSLIQNFMKMGAMEIE